MRSSALCARVLGGAALLSLGLCALPARATVRLPAAQVRVEQGGALVSSSTRGEAARVADQWLSQTVLSYQGHRPWRRYRLLLGVSAGMTTARRFGTLAFHGEAGWQWLLRRSAHERTLYTGLRLSLGVGGDPQLDHPVMPRALRDGRAEITAPLRWVHELTTAKGRTQGLTALVELEPSARLGGPRANSLNVLGRVGAAYLFPSFAEARLHLTGQYATSEEARWRVGVQPELRVHVCARRLPRLRRRIVSGDTSRCASTLALFGHIEPLAAQAQRRPWSAGMRMIIRWQR